MFSSVSRSPNSAQAPGGSLVIGGAGFIGSNLAEELVARGEEATILDGLLPGTGANPTNIKHLPKSAGIHVSEIGDNEQTRCALAGKSTIYILSGHTGHLDSMTNPLWDLNLNVTGFLGLLEAIRSLNPEARVIFTSTRQVYGKPQRELVDETHPISPVDINGINKHTAEEYLRIYRENYGLDTWTLRLTNTYGPRMRIRDAKQNFLGHWIGQSLVGNPITVYGDGSLRRDFNFVSDVVEALLLVSKISSGYNGGRVFNLGGSETVSLKQVATLLLEYSPKASIEWVPFPEERRRIEIGNFRGDFSRFQEVANWSPLVDLATGLKKTVEFFAANLENYIAEENLAR